MQVLLLLLPALPLLLLPVMLCVAKLPNCQHQMIAVQVMHCPIHSSLLLYCLMVLLLG
jgi:hypothetical protein